MKKIQQAAEAIIYKDGSDAVKERIKKNYRIKEIDEPLRASRTRLEARLIDKARGVGVHTPKISSISDYSIRMEFVNGEKVKDLFINEAKRQRKSKLTKKICKLIGQSIAKLHNAGIIHGDLTTSNMIWMRSGKSGELYFIDFGLAFNSQRAEDKAVDLHLLQQALISTHFTIADFCWLAVLESYKKQSKAGEEVLKRLALIEKRGRYQDRPKE